MKFLYFNRNVYFYIKNPHKFKFYCLFLNRLYRNILKKIDPIYRYLVTTLHLTHFISNSTLNSTFASNHIQIFKVIKINQIFAPL